MQLRGHVDNVSLLLLTGCSYKLKFKNNPALQVFKVLSLPTPCRGKDCISVSFNTQIE